MRDRGITLIELTIVVTIIGILLVALGFSYVGWQGKYKVEKTTKDLFTDLMDARTRALTRNRAYFADFLSGTTYRVIEDTNDNAVIDNGDMVLPNTVLPAVATPRSLEYTVTIGTTGAEPPITFNFNKKGVSSPERTICFSTTNDSDYDCIIISDARINMGKLTTSMPDGGVCRSSASGGDCNAK